MGIVALHKQKEKGKCFLLLFPSVASPPLFCAKSLMAKEEKIFACRKFSAACFSLSLSLSVLLNKGNLTTRKEEEDAREETTNKTDYYEQ